MIILKQRFSTTSLGIAATALMLLVASCWVIEGDDSIPGRGNFAPVARASTGPLAITVTESAILEARQSVSLASELPSNKAKILYLAGDGALVRKGEVIARFDPSPIEDEIAKLDSDILEAQALIQQAAAELVLLETEAGAKIGKLEQQTNAARVRLASLQSAGAPNQRDAAATKLQRARADHDQARRELATQQRLLDQGLARQNDHTKAAEVEQQRRADLDIAEREFTNLTEVALPAELTAARLSYDHSQRELDNFSTIVLPQQVIKQKADITRHQTRLATLRHALDQARKQLAATTLTAPVSGQLVFRKISIDNDKRRVQVGDSLWHRQQFAELPDMSRMMARLQVREADIGKLRRGQRATVYPEAYPELALEGTLETIGTLTEDGKSATGNAFEVRVALAAGDARLRPGMAARVVIHARRYAEVVHVPVEAVFYLEQRPVCFLWRGGRPQAVPVTLGDSDGSSIAILSGLQAGAEVMLVFPDSYDSEDPDR